MAGDTELGDIVEDIANILEKYIAAQHETNARLNKRIKVLQEMIAILGATQGSIVQNQLKNVILKEREEDFVRKHSTEAGA